MCFCSTIGSVASFFKILIVHCFSYFCIQLSNTLLQLSRDGTYIMDIPCWRNRLVGLQLGKMLYISWLIFLGFHSSGYLTAEWFEHHRKTLENGACVICNFDRECGGIAVTGNHWQKYRFFYYLQGYFAWAMYMSVCYRYGSGRSSATLHSRGQNVGVSTLI